MTKFRKSGYTLGAVTVLALIALVGLLEPVHAQAELNLGPGYRSPLAPPHMPPILPASQYLASELRINMRLAAYLQQLDVQFGLADADADGKVSDADIPIHLRFAVAMYRDRILLDVMGNDIDGDGIVTEDEVRQKLRYQRRYSPGPSGNWKDQVIDSEVRWVMAADANHDGRITFDEALAYAVARAKSVTTDPNVWRVQQLLVLAPQGQNAVTMADVEAAGKALFATIDTDGDGIVSVAELNTYHERYPLPAGPLHP